MQMNMHIVLALLALFASMMPTAQAARSWCGGDGEEPCPRGGCEDDLIEVDGICEYCGNNGEPPCGDGCKDDLTEQDGYCWEPCGNVGLPPCDFAPDNEETGGCPPPLFKNDDGLCESCGDQGEAPCENGEPYWATCVDPLSGEVSEDNCDNNEEVNWRNGDSWCNYEWMFVTDGKCECPEGYGCDDRR